jgi:hypothetical protein
MELNSLLLAENIDPREVLVLRHRPPEPKLFRVLPRLASEEPEVFNAYQQTQTKRVEKAMSRASYVASFIGRESGKALFVGLYSVVGSRPISLEAYWQIGAYIRMKERYDVKGFTGEDGRSTVLWFDLALTEFHASWKGKLVVGWPPPEISWWRRAHRNKMPVVSILEESALDPAMPEWHEIALRWEDLELLSASWRSKLAEWRVIYYIFDALDGKGYVGSAYGADNLLGRWLNYAASGHGGNALLRNRDPRNFRFSILQRVSPDEDANDVVRLEGTWKKRLHTRWPDGLNDN